MTTSAPSDAPATLTVARLAARAGISGDTVRFYEREGLLPPAARSSAGYRTYDESALDRLRFIQGTKRLGLRLADIRDLLAVRDTGECPCEPAEAHLQRRLADVDARITELTSLRDQMAAMLRAIPTGECPAPAPGTWCPQPGGSCSLHDEPCGCDPAAASTASTAGMASTANPAPTRPEGR